MINIYILNYGIYNLKPILYSIGYVRYNIKKNSELCLLHIECEQNPNVLTISEYIPYHTHRTPARPSSTKWATSNRPPPAPVRRTKTAAFTRVCRRASPVTPTMTALIERRRVITRDGSRWPHCWRPLPLQRWSGRSPVRCPMRRHSPTRTEAVSSHVLVHTVVSVWERFCMVWREICTPPIYKSND